jgi:heptosyltransferase-2
VKIEKKKDFMDRTVAYDCRYFLGDRPCIWHKQNGAMCECERYTQLTGSILIIKLDAMGDVLRTTCLLPLIEATWPGRRITWLTRGEAVPLLENNPYVTDIIPYNTEALISLGACSFEHVINLDAGRISAGLAAMARAKKKTGYILHEDGYVAGTNAAAEEWLRMGIFDDLKRLNSRSYQEIMCSILGLGTEGMKYVLQLTEAEIKAGRDHLLKLGLDLDRKIIGIHTGGGGRWRLKQWDEEKFIRLIAELADTQILLFGGPLEREQNRRIVEQGGVPVFDAGCGNEVRHFASIVSYCSAVLSGDSLAMHIALAMGRRTIVLFGPTSNSEIELFGLGEKVMPDLDCLSCYKKECNFVPNCMDSISVAMVKEAVMRQMAMVK